MILRSTTSIFRAIVSWPYDGMSATRSCKLDRDSMSKLANMEYLVEKTNHEDFASKGIKAKLARQDIEE